MARWFARLMQKGHVGSPRTIAGAGFSGNEEVQWNPDARDARFDEIVQRLRDREVADRDARERRQRWYRQSLRSDSSTGSGASSPCSPLRLSRLRTKVPCRVTPEARALLDELRNRFPGGTVTIAQVANGRQAVMLTACTGAEPKQIGWVEHCVQTDPTLCNVRHQGLAVETDGGAMLVLRFRYPATSVRMSSRRTARERRAAPDSRRANWRVAASRGADALELPGSAVGDLAWADFTEIRPALDLRPSDKGSSPRGVWVTRPEADTMNALRSREYEAFYLRFKLEVLTGIWHSLSGLLSSSPGSQWHRGSHYAVEREPDATKFRIHQRTVDDSGRAVDIGSDRIYDAASATDMLLLYLDGDLLADFADIYFTLQTLGSTDAYFLKEEFFTVVRRFWTDAQSLASHYGSDLAAVLRMSQRAAPMPAQAQQLKQDWTNLRQSLVDRYGEGGRHAAGLVAQDVHRPRVGRPGWPFASFPAGEVNVGLRLIFRQEWRHLGAQRGDVVRTVPPLADRMERTSAIAGRVDTTIEQGDSATNLDDVVHEAVDGAVEAMKWPLDFEGSVNTGVRALAATTEMGLESECRESSRDTSTRLGDIMLRMASRTRDEAPVAEEDESADGVESSTSPVIGNAVGRDAATYVHSRLQNLYEVVTRPAEIQNVVLVAERLPAPAEIDLSWVRRHDWILSKVLLDESFREALDGIGQEARSPESSPDATEPRLAFDEIVERVDASHDRAIVRLDDGGAAREWGRCFHDPADELPARLRPDLELVAKRERLYEHLRANILHYQRAIWQREDPQQRSMRYRKSGKKVPLEWRFELEWGGALSVGQFGDRLTAANVDGQFAAYSAGREADLDQVIDPAGPIGYYGNYAIYHMRPEFGSAELFSMLHFFKSPYLRPNPETGEPEVEDPALIRISDDPAVATASDEVIERHRDEMFQLVPELRLERARAWKKVSDGTDPSAVYRLERETGALRRHFAAYLFRRERSRRIALDADAQVIDVIRDTEAAPGKPQRNDAGMYPGEAPEGYRLMLESGRGIELLSAGGRRVAEAEWAILRGDGAARPILLAGAGGGAASSDDHEAEPVIRARDGQRPRALLAGVAHDPDAARVILAREGGEMTLDAVVGIGATDAQQGVLPLVNAEGATPTLIAGAAAPESGERVVSGRGDGWLKLVSVGGGASQLREQPIVAGSDDQRTASLRAGRAQHADTERGILTRDDAGLRIASIAGARAVHTDERAILATGEGGRTTGLLAGAGASDADERLVLSGGDEAGTLRLHAGRAQDTEAERVILARDDEGLRISSVADAGASPAHERVILAPDDDWLRPSLVAG